MHFLEENKYESWTSELGPMIWFKKNSPNWLAKNLAFSRQKLLVNAKNYHNIVFF
jgi:hypothetical protein